MLQEILNLQKIMCKFGCFESGCKKHFKKYKVNKKLIYRFYE